MGKPDVETAGTGFYASNPRIALQVRAVAPSRKRMAARKAARLALNNGQVRI